MTAFDIAPSAPTPAASLSLRDAAYGAIKARIIRCEFRPGEVLNEAALASGLGLGRTPVHQALQRLEAEGLVSIIPRKGVLVTPLSIDEVLEMIEVRLCNEVLCVGLAIERASQTEIAAMDELLARVPALIVERDVAALSALDLQFHLAISAAARNRVLADLLRSLHERQARFWFLSLATAGHQEAVHQEHRRILEAFRTRDVAAGQRAMRDHIEAFRSTIGRSI
ncbi:GntR family transcriptional regulator [Pseudomonas solani]|uniref:GntR family transcriptional regulator n=1 Tax=Pseudomonas solani TaxID=2731552 RepID=A0ABN6BXP3_9PSED|nr:GntR family transcriptional regulator [Pseudomonas solani]BCD88583.1 GntR family transcriptional regulator [Pseudomonas solani]